MNPIIRPWRQILDFRGRATRTEYLLFHVTIIVVVVISEMLSLALLGAFGGDATGQPAIGAVIVAGILSLFYFVLVVGFLIGHVSIAIRRLHDHGEPGIKYLLTFIPLIGLIFWLMMVFAKGDDYENDYGPDPRRPAQVGIDELGAVFD